MTAFQNDYPLFNKNAKEEIVIIINLIENIT